MILSSIRFLPYIKDGAGLEEKMMEILPSCTIDVQREIILSLPDILDDSQHEKVANSLKVTLDKTSELTCTILDCLTNLSLDGGGVLKELLDIVLKRLGRIDLDDLPTVVEFIISTSQGGDYIDVVQVKQFLQINQSVWVGKTNHLLISEIIYLFCIL